MGPCATCGQLTEPDADFCPACAGYAAPATVYSYAPSRLSRSDSEPDQVLIPLPLARATVSDQWPAAQVPGWQPSEPVPGPPTASNRSRDRGTRMRPGAGRREGRWLVAAATLIVLIIAAGTALLELGRHPHASAPPARPAASSSTPPASVTPVPGAQITVVPAAASSAYEAAVLSFLTSYFAAINDHDFAAYQQLFSPQLRADLSAPTFSAGYQTTTDSAITLSSIGVVGSGELDAQVSFVSHQQPAASPTDSACTSWSVSLYLLQQGGSYLLQQPPAGYQASYTACS